MGGDYTANLEFHHGERFVKDFSANALKFRRRHFVARGSVDEQIARRTEPSSRPSGHQQLMPERLPCSPKLSVFCRLEGFPRLAAQRLCLALVSCSGQPLRL